MSSSDVAGLVINNDEDKVRENGKKEASFVSEEEDEIKLKEDAANTLQRLLLKIISSGTLLKYVACISGLWVGSHLWSFLSVLFTVPLLMMSLIGEAMIVFYCGKKSAMKSNSTVTFCRKTRGDLRDLSVDEYEVYQFLRFFAVVAQVVCFVSMRISVWRSRYKSEVLSLDEAYNLVKRKKWLSLNFQLIVFFTLLVTSNLLNSCCSSKGPRSSCDGVGAMLSILRAIVLWLTVISCLVYATVINGAIAQAKQRNQEIMDMD